MKRFVAAIILIFFLTVSAFGSDFVLCTITLTCVPQRASSCCGSSPCGSPVETIEVSEKELCSVTIVRKLLLFRGPIGQHVVFGDNCECKYSICKLGETLASKTNTNLIASPISQPIFTDYPEFRQTDISANCCTPKMIHDLISTTVLRC